jgi:hypothetical protein
MIVMLLLVGVLIVHLRDPGTVRALETIFNAGNFADEEVAAAAGPKETGKAAGAGRKTAEADETDGWRAAGSAAKGATLALPQGPPAEAPPAQGPPAEPPNVEPGPTDEDPEQAEAIEYEFQAVSDRTLWIKPEEMIPYNRIVLWVLNQTTVAMRKRARSDLTFNDFLQSPKQYRGQLVEFTLNARLVHNCPEPPVYPSPLLEVWGPSPESGSFPFAAIVVDLPKGIPVGRDINERVRFVGYFFKLQGYSSRGSKPGDPLQLAPMFIGRMTWIKPGDQGPAGLDLLGRWTEGVSGWLLAGGVMFVVLVTVAIAWMAARRPKSRLRRVPSPSGLQAPRLDQWLDGVDTEASEASAEETNAGDQETSG